MNEIYLSRQQVRQIDRIAIEQYGIPGIVLMENASKNAAHEALVLLQSLQKSALILCGPGNNGGDGLAIARHLHNNSIPITLASTLPPDAYQGDAAINAHIIHKMNLPISPLTPALINAWQGGLIIDAIFGTGLTRPTDENFAAIARAVNNAHTPVLAVDLPSGLDCDAGVPLGAAIHADVTVTFVAHKKGFANPDSQKYTGRVIVADIGAPIDLIRQITQAK